MIDSTNPRSMADNIRKLWEKFSKISGDLLPSRSTATTGQILKLTGESKTPSWADEYSYTPPAYSATETATGQKWINGKDIYKKTFAGALPEITATINFQLTDSFEGDYIINSEKTLVTSGGTLYSSFNNLLLTASGILVIANVATTYSEGSYSCTVYYTKPDPTPGRAPEDPDQEPEQEPEEKKTVRKKK